MTTDIAREQFLELLRAGLWGRRADASLFNRDNAPTDWKLILKYAREQTVIPLVYDGTASLPMELRPDNSIMFKLMAHVDKIEKMNIMLDKAAAVLSSRLAEEGIHSVLLKGQGNARLYPNPLRRQCGDIDLYVGEKNYVRAMGLFREWGIVDDEHEATTKHTSFKWKDVTVELHKHAFEMSDPASEKDFRKWENEILSGEAFKSHPSYVTLETEKVNVPPPTFNAIFIFAHAFHHFMTSGIGLRQLCDLSAIIDRKHDEIDWKLLGEMLVKYKLDREWSIFIDLCCNSLGLGRDKAGFRTPSIQTGKKEARLLDFIFSEGNFGQYKKGSYYFDKPLLIRKSISFWKHNVRYFQRIRIFGRQTFYHYIHTLVNGLKHMNK